MPHRYASLSLWSWLLAGSLLLCPQNAAHAFAFIFAGEINGLDIITHPSGYTGAGGVLTVTVGIDPTSVNATAMVTPVENVIAVFNNLTATTGNLLLGAANDLPASDVDFESTLLHELGHSLGLAHVNLATESGLLGDDRNYTKSTDGANNTHDIAFGGDGLRGSADDLRGDDVNLHYFRTTDNNPFVIGATVDATTYSRNVANLPAGDLYATNADRDVATLMGYPNTEAVMQQGAFFDEAQRTLAADDVAGLRYAMSGLDEIAGTADDYTLNLVYAGLTTSADIVIDFDNNETGFAVSQSGGTFLNATHLRISSNNIYFNTGYNWYFTTAVLDASALRFSAQLVQGDAHLDWSLPPSLDLSQVEIERSSDGHAWEWRATQPVTAARSGHYRDPLTLPEGSQVHYRLRQTRPDGSFFYSPVQTLRLQAPETGVITFGPVPFTLGTYLDLYVAESLPVRLRILSLDGREAQRHTYDLRPGRHELVLGPDLLRLPAGVYLLEVQAGAYREVLKFTR